ncbi:MAG: AraC family transcriptional regulator [Moraxellaceae bacterium]|nr:MAG: AraC family transcriptional regulator [Moraxellaceae bacterium]
MSEQNDSSLLYLWEYRTLYLGPISELSPVNQGASSLLIGIEGPFELVVQNEKKITTRSALIPAGGQIELDSFGKSIAMCYLDPLGVDFSALRKTMQSKCKDIFFDSEFEKSNIEKLLNIKLNALEPAQAYRILIDDILPADAYNETLNQVSPEVKEVIAIIKREPLLNHSNDELAERVGLSGDKLQRLFKSCTGIPIRRYRLWYRLFVTANLMACGMTLTDAALQTGFSDSSHFNRTFRSMLGMKPSFVLRRNNEVKIFAGGDIGVHAGDTDSTA